MFIDDEFANLLVLCSTHLPSNFTSLNQMSVFLPSELQNVFININLPLSVVSFFFLVFIFQLKKYRYKLIVTSVTDA